MITKRIVIYPTFECSDGTNLIDPDISLEATASMDKDLRTGKAKIIITISNLPPVTAEQIYSGLDLEDTELSIYNIPTVIGLVDGKC